MSELIVGIDCGTSYIKAAAFTDTGELVATVRARSPTSPGDGTVDPAAWWEVMVRELGALVDAVRPARVCALAITCVSPVLVAFDEAQPEKAIGLTYRAIPAIDCGTTGVERTIRRAGHLRSQSHAFARTCTLGDLTGYLVFRLTGTLCLNTACGAEFGFRAEDAIQSVFQNAPGRELAIMPPATPCGDTRAAGLTAEAIVCSGATDSLGTLLESGLRNCDSLMLYLGTYGSLLRLSAGSGHADQLGTTLSRDYEWRLSIPRLGPTIESLVSAWYPELDTGAALERLDLQAWITPSRSASVYMTVPVQAVDGIEVGDYKFHRDAHTLDAVAPADGARAVLEAVGVAARCLAPGELETAKQLHAVGGGASSSRWLQILADTCGLPIVRPATTTGCLGAASLAAGYMGYDWRSLLESTVHPMVLPRPDSEADIELLLAHAYNWYQRYYFNKLA